MNVRNWKTRFSRALLAMLLVSGTSAFAAVTEDDSDGSGVDTYDLSGGGVSAGLTAATRAGTSVTNDALVDFEVNGTAQNTVDTSSNGGTGPATFEVDRLVDVDVSERSGDQNSATAGGTGVMSWSVTNESNDDVDLFLRVEQITADVFGLGTAQVTNASTVNTVCIDGNSDNDCDDGGDTTLSATGGIYLLVGDDGTNDLTPGTAVTITVTFDVDADAENGEYDSFVLAAGVGSDLDGTRITSDDNGNQVPPDGAGSGTDNADIATGAGAVQNVFADAAGTDAVDFTDGSIAAAGEAFDGQHSDRDQFEIDVAVITVTKVSEVVWDPVTGLKYDLSDDTNSRATFDTGTTVATPHAIPGAVVQYTITVENDASAGAPAEEVTLSDDLPDEVQAGNVEGISLLDSTNQTCDSSTATGLAGTGGTCETGTNPGTLLDETIVTDCAGTETTQAVADPISATVATGAVECDPGDSGTVVYYMTVP